MTIKYKYAVLAATAMMTVLSCSKDGEMLTASLPEGGTEISTVEKEIILTPETASSLALTVYWNSLGEISLSNPDAQIAENASVTMLQFSADKDFTVTDETALSAGTTSRQFTVAQLNNIADRLDMSGETASDMYMRIRQSLGANTESTYGNTVKVTVTPYTMDMSRVQIVSSASGETSTTLPATGDRTYAGFMNASSWYNFFFMEGNGSIWGTANDGSSGSAFRLQSMSDFSSWNCWFPEPAGSYYVTMSAAEEAWTALFLSSITAQTGDTETVMTYNAKENSWSCNISVTSGEMRLKLPAAGQLYNATTGDSSYQEAAAGFTAASDGSIDFHTGEAAESVITAAFSGEGTLTLDIDEMKWSLSEGVEEPPVPQFDEFFYMFYSWPAADGGYWPEEYAATLWSKDRDGMFYGYFSTPDTWSDQINSCFYNFTFSTARTAEEGTRYGVSASDSHTLAEITSPVSPDEVWAGWPATYGLTRISVNMESMTWAEESLPICVTGDFNGWSLSSDPMTFDTGTKLWSATCEIGTIGYGIQIVLGTDWNYVFGGTDGILYQGGNNIVPAGTGTYKITVDLRDASAPEYTLEKL